MTEEANTHVVKGEWKEAAVIREHFRIKAIAVLPAWRRHGIGGRLLESAWHIVGERLLGAVESKPALTKFYQNAGYRVLESRQPLIIPVPESSEPIAIGHSRSDYRWVIRDPSVGGFLE
jgi:GNAT superfamily N-acetyltransferase